MVTEDNALTRPASELLAALTASSEPLARFEDVPLQVEVRLGRARVPLGELLRLRAGAVLTLERRVGEEAEVLIGGQVVALGQIVVVGNELGVRITQLAGARAQA